MNRIFSVFITVLILSITSKPILATDLEIRINQTYRRELMQELNVNVARLFEQSLDLRNGVILITEPLTKSTEIVQKKSSDNADQEI